jgi:aerobic-type carbon monoxide dehydrogenase small subunit (CoxS/CutS family)
VDLPSIDSAMSIHFSLNGQPVQTPTDPDTSLLAVLTQDFAINGTKYGCGKAQCGSCTVLINGEPVRSCVTPASSAAGRSVTTLAGLSRDGQPNRLQQAFIDEQAAQCGFCTSGMILQAQALLDRNPSPSEAQVRTALDGNLCRCGIHNRVVKAVMRAAKGA